MVVALQGFVDQAAAVEVGEGPGAFGAEEADGAAGGDARGVGAPAGGWGMRGSGRVGVGRGHKVRRWE